MATAPFDFEKPITDLEDQIDDVEKKLEALDEPAQEQSEDGAEPEAAQTESADEPPTDDGDEGQETVPDYDFIAFPPRGLMPVELFLWPKDGYPCAWHISLNSKKYSPLVLGELEVVVYPVNGKLGAKTESRRRLPRRFAKGNIRNLLIASGTRVKTNTDHRVVPTVVGKIKIIPVSRKLRRILRY